MVEISNSYQPLDELSIAEVENRLKISLPQDLKDFYLKHNGGRPSPSLFPKYDDFFEVHAILPMWSGNPRFSFENTYELLVLNTPEFPRGFIPFASDQGGDHFLYSVRNQDFGAVFFNQSDYFDDPERYVVFLAPSLQAFWDGLTDDEGR